MDEVSLPERPQTTRRTLFLLATAATAGAVSFALNVVILLSYVPKEAALRPIIIVQIAFWTFVGALGAGSVIAGLYYFVRRTKYFFLAIAAAVLAASFIPIYLHAGIIHMFALSSVPEVVTALSTMHIVDAFIITASLLIL